ncbi:hypothetical protein CI238_10171 [Colletotrichum incanum]|uniref:Uncharacterized protein n=1 Tax=Colletotrichum incanum TaxID=1573173 RepID=A0A161Y821_COLIC|nr:hypothetical protein CI238_10171 [Colletotrichum incanum]
MKKLKNIKMRMFEPRRDDKQMGPWKCYAGFGQNKIPALVEAAGQTVDPEKLRMWWDAVVQPCQGHIDDAPLVALWLLLFKKSSYCLSLGDGIGNRCLTLFKPSTTPDGTLSRDRLR